MASEWVMIRVKKTTHANLKQLKEMFDRMEVLPKGIDTSSQDRFGVSLDGIISLLIERDNNHRERSRGRKRQPTAERSEGNLE